LVRSVRIRILIGEKFRIWDDPNPAPLRIHNTGKKYRKEKNAIEGCMTDTHLFGSCEYLWLEQPRILPEHIGTVLLFFVIVIELSKELNVLFRVKNLLHETFKFLNL